MTAASRPRDADAQEIADRMAPFVAAAGFAAEWADLGPAIVETYVEAIVKDAEKRLDRAFASMGGGTQRAWVTLRHDLSTGHGRLLDAPGQAENRIILDGSCERDKLLGYRSFCRLFGELLQPLLALANEVHIARAPLDKWILENAPHPDGPCSGLRIVILLPPPSYGPQHFSDCRKAAHLAVIKARRSAGKPAELLLSGDNSWVGDCDGLAEFLASSPPQDVFRVELSAKSFTEDWLPCGQKANNVMLLAGVTDWPSGAESIGLFTQGEPAEYWRGVLGDLRWLHRSGDARHSGRIISAVAFRQAEAPKWLH